MNHRFLAFLALFFSISLYAQDYVVAIDANYPPFSLYDYDNERASGLDIDILKEVARRENISFKFKPLPWGEWRQILNEDKADLWAGGVAILNERKKEASFSESYMSYGTGIILRNGETVDVENLGDYRLAAVDGTTDFDYIQSVGAKETKSYKTLYLAMKALASNEVDAVVGNYAVGSYHANHYPDRFAIEPLYARNHSDQLLGFMLAKNADEALLQKINQGINAMLEDGTMNALERKWLGEN